ncbi:amidohydrolase family protein [Proteocatella sphenisci]|uniref:amidohydrolase family protein n=1 Tax=Proteocatella sphenisci TaxID=181070 RepID=UPI00048D2D5D|nr:amidohydrolase family protein [Proteocatella sphenisci]
MINEMAVQGSAFYSVDFDKVRYIKNGIFCVNDKGYIDGVYEEGDEDYSLIRLKYLEKGKLKVLSDTEVMLPGFVDLHIHASQWPQAGLALDRPLEIWLGEYTFPLESRYRNLDFANEVYRDVVSSTLKYGTTTALYFATVDREPSVLLAKICGELGQRGLVGKVAMDNPESTPEFCRDNSPKEAINETEAFIKEVLEIQDLYKQKVYPVVTPRFIPSCTDETLEGLGKLAKKYDAHIQTHCSESDWAHNFAKERFGITDAQALDKFGLITSKTVVAHAPFLEPDDVKLLADKKTTIGHCPLSNAYFANSVLPFKDFSSRGVNIGMATDISGGYSPSMYQAIRQSIISSRMLEDGVDPSINGKNRGRKNSAITLNNALYSATVSGGIALGLPIGKLEKGYSFDVQIVDIEKNIPKFYPEKSEEDILHKVLLLSESSNIKEVWVQGNRVKC